MKRFIVLLITAIMIVSMFGVLTAFAGASISGYSNVYAGSSKTYTGKASFTGLDMVGKIEGLGKVSSFTVDSGSSDNGSLTKSASITVKIPSDAKPGDTYKITFSGSYSVKDSSGAKAGHTFSTSKTITVVERSTNTGGSSPGTVQAAAAPTEWDIAATNVEAMPSGGAITVDIKDDPKIPVSLLSSVKEKQGTLTINFSSYTCAIDGKALGSIPEDIKSIDLSMKTDKDESFSAAAGGKDAYQLHFAYKGQLPGKFSYSFKAENSKPGDILYLYYYYDQSGVCEGIQSAAVDASGYITFEIYHCSGYFVSANAVEGASGADFSSEAALREAEGKLAQLQAQLEDARNSSEELQPEIVTLRSETPPDEDPLTAPVSAPADNLFGVPYGSLIAALSGAALVSMFLTMLICRVGIFRRKANEKADT